VLAVGAAAGCVDAPLAWDRRDPLPGSEPLATVGGSVTRLDPLTLTPTGRRADLGEYHDTYSFAPDGSRIAFGISAPGDDSAIGPPGRVGIRLIRSRDLTVSADIRIGVYGAALAWLRPRRLVALRGVGGVVTDPPPQPPFDATVVTVDPNTGEVLKRRRLPFGASEFHCDAADARERALLVLARRNLFVIGPGGGVRTFGLPREFRRCGQIALAPGGRRAFVVAKGGDVVTEVALARSRRIVHRLPAGPGGNAVGLGHRRLLLAHRPNGVELINARRESRRTIDRKAGAARLVKGTVLTYDGRRRGVRGYAPDGERRFRLLGGKRIAKVEAAGRFAYAIRRDGVAIIDHRRALRHGGQPLVG
jgi:hypothetical protein